MPAAIQPATIGGLLQSVLQDWIAALPHAGARNDASVVIFSICNFAFGSKTNARNLLFQHAAG